MSQILSGMRRKGLTATQLKMFAAVTMFIDHLTFTFLERTIDAAAGTVTAYSSDLLYLLDLLGRAVGRQAFPIFAFFIVEGYHHTGSRRKYLARLVLFAVISQVPFRLMCGTGPVGSGRVVGLNVYATLALGLCAIWIVDAVFMRRLPACGLRTLAGPNNASPDRPCSPAELVFRGIAAIAAVAGICAAAVYLNTDYDYIGVIAIVLFYLLRGNRRAAVMVVWVWITWGSSLEFFALPGLLLLILYNGQRGGSRRLKAMTADPQRPDVMTAEPRRPDTRTAEPQHPDAPGSGRAFVVLVRRYAFYIFYPAHMVVLYALRVLLCGY